MKGIRVSMQSTAIELMFVPPRRTYELLPWEFNAVAFGGLMALREVCCASVGR